MLNLMEIKHFSAQYSSKPAQRPNCQLPKVAELPWSKASNSTIIRTYNRAAWPGACKRLKNRRNAGLDPTWELHVPLITCSSTMTTFSSPMFWSRLNPPPNKTATAAECDPVWLLTSSGVTYNKIQMCWGGSSLIETSFLELPISPRASETVSTHKRWISDPGEHLYPAGLFFGQFSVC